MFVCGANNSYQATNLPPPVSRPRTICNLLSKFTSAQSLKKKSWKKYIFRCVVVSHWVLLFIRKTQIYFNIKKSFCIEEYLLHFAPHFRRNFTKIRISTNNLAKESGRYTKPVETPIERVPFHFILECSLYQVERKITCQIFYQ